MELPIPAFTSVRPPAVVTKNSAVSPKAYRRTIAYGEQVDEREGREINVHQPSQVQMNASMRRVIAPTMKSRSLMRQMSGLGMEDPVFGPEHFEKQAPEHPSLIFEDMAINDIPEDMRDMISVASDPTAAVGMGLDVANFQACLSGAYKSISDYSMMELDLAPPPSVLTSTSVSTDQDDSADMGLHASPSTLQTITLKVQRKQPSPVGMVTGSPHVRGVQRRRSPRLRPNRKADTDALHNSLNNICTQNLFSFGDTGEDGVDKEKLGTCPEVDDEQPNTDPPHSGTDIFASKRPAPSTQTKGQQKKAHSGGGHKRDTADSRKHHEHQRKPPVQDKMAGLSATSRKNIPSEPLPQNASKKALSLHERPVQHQQKQSESLRRRELFESHSPRRKQLGVQVDEAKDEVALGSNKNRKRDSLAKHPSKACMPSPRSSRPSDNHKIRPSQKSKATGAGKETISSSTKQSQQPIHDSITSMLSESMTSLALDDLIEPLNVKNDFQADRTHMNCTAKDTKSPVARCSERQSRMLPTKSPLGLQARIPEEQSTYDRSPVKDVTSAAAPVDKHQRGLPPMSSVFPSACRPKPRTGREKRRTRVSKKTPEGLEAAFNASSMSMSMSMSMAEDLSEWDPFEAEDDPAKLWNSISTDLLHGTKY